MPVGGALIRSADFEERRLAKLRSDDLHADRETG